ncbi:hypothetical protein PG984_000259 [Apiospora sp. TS-2023a]
MAEVAGLVLGAIPLLLSALEHSGDITGPIDRLFRWKSYDQTLRILLKGVVDDEELSDMLQDPQCGSWGRPGLERDLKDKLETAYDSCMSTIWEMDSVLKEIASSIYQLGGASQIHQSGLRGVLNGNPPAQSPLGRIKQFDFATGLRYTMTNRQIKHSLEKLQNCNDRLDDFISKAGRIQDEPSVSSSRISFIAPLDDIRHNATQIYCAITRSWCAFHKTHSAAWRLESRIRRRKKIGRRLVDRAGVGEPGRCQDGTEALLRYLFCAQARASSAMEFRLDKQGSLRCHSRDDLVFPLLDERGETLEVLMPKLKFHMGAMMDFYTLIINLVTALVQLGGTPWLRKPWTKRDIMFFETRGNAAENTDVLHPYLVNQHPEDALPVNDPLQCNEIDRNNIATLGVMILELQSGRSIEEFRTPDDGPCSTGSNLLVATRVLDKLYHRGSISEGLTRAITYCLQSSIHPATSLTDEQFVDTFIEQTVGPLEKERRVLMG